MHCYATEMDLPGLRSHTSSDGRARFACMLASRRQRQRNQWGFPQTQGPCCSAALQVVFRACRQPDECLPGCAPAPQASRRSTRRSFLVGKHETRACKRPPSTGCQAPVGPPCSQTKPTSDQPRMVKSRESTFTDRLLTLCQFTHDCNCSQPSTKQQNC